MKKVKEKTELSLEVSDTEDIGGDTPIGDVTENRVTKKGPNLILKDRNTLLSIEVCI
jgi:hypothetical protein